MSSDAVPSLMETTDENKSATADSTSDTTATATVIIPRMKKVRKRGAFKSSTTPLEDEQEDEKEENAAGGMNLQAIRQIQELRHKKSSALQLGEHALLLPDRETMEAEAAAAAAATASNDSTMRLSVAPSMGQEFGTTGSGAMSGSSSDMKEVQQSLIDQQMEKYIQDQLAARRALRQPQKPQGGGDGGSSASTSTTSAVNLSEDQLFVTPAHLAIQSNHVAEEEEAERWLTGISEQPLSINDKMRNIEQTEKAKAAFLAAEAKRRAQAASLVLPANFNANFRLHKQEWDGKRRDEFTTFMDAQNRQQALAVGLPAPAPSAPRAAPSLMQQANALPGFLAGGESEKNWLPGGVARGGYQGGGDRIAEATDDRVADRFVKRFKHK